MVANRQDRLQRYKDKVSEYTEVSRKVRDDARTLQAEYVEEQNELKDKHNKNFVDEFEEVGTAQMAPL
jgi:transcription initiation factor TFIIIB Brf1 subunit/transcription initiation factor TFIIB